MVPMRLLIVEDDKDFAKVLSREFEDKSFNVLWAEDLIKTRSFIKAHHVDYAIVDLRLKGDNGLQVLKEIKDTHPSCQAIVLTGYGSIPTAVEAVKMGAKAYLTKPASISDIEKSLLSEQISASLEENETPPPSKPQSLARHEHEYIDYVLTQCRGNISKAARWLGIHRQSLQRKLKKYPPKH